MTQHAVVDGDVNLFGTTDAEGELVRTEGARFRDYLEAWEESRRMAREHRKELSR